MLTRSKVVKIINKTANWFLTKPKMTGLLFFLFLLTFNALIVLQRYELFQENKNREISRILNQVQGNIDQSLKNYYTLSLTLALTIGENGEPKNFASVADKLMRSNPQLQAVQLVPDGIIKYVYPLRGNEKVLNLNVFKTSAQTAIEARKAIQRKRMYYQGPAKLVQGGVGLVGRLPVFINDKFWGFTAIAIKIDTFFRESGIDNSRYRDYRFRFSKLNASTGKEAFFLDFKEKTTFSQSKSITFTDGDWKVYVCYINKTDVWLQLIGTIMLGLGLTVLSSYLLIRLMIKQSDLQQMFNLQGKELINTESKFKGIFDHAAIGIARVNSKTGELLEVNKYLCEFLDFTAEELIHKKIKTLIHPNDIEEESRLFKLFINGEIRQINDEKRYISRSGAVKWSSVIITPLWKKDEEPTNHIIILEDSSARKAAAQVLVESQHRIQSLINTIDGIVWESYIDTEEIIFISKKVEDILGYTVKQWKSNPKFWVNHIYPDDRDAMVEYLRVNLLKKNQFDAEYRMLAKDGTIVWIRNIITVVEEQGQPAKLRGIMIDITMQKQAEVALQQSFTLVTEQNKRLLNFSYIVSHNLRSHASNIQGITDLIENAPSAQERDEMIQLLKTVGNNLNETLLNLNNVVNIQSSIDIIIEPLNLSDYIQRTLATLNAQILRKKVLFINKVDEAFLINYNRAYLESILLNLFSNAIRYSHQDREPIISLVCFEEDGQQVLSVSDNGLGINLEKYGDKMFGMYQTFNGNADARGYGLFITKNQIEAMGGKIEVESQIGKGTTFKVYFKG